jgi:hypothetical protein
MAKKLETDERAEAQHRARDIHNNICITCSVPMPCLFDKAEREQPIQSTD